MGRRAAQQLSVKRVASLDRPGRYADGNGLYLQVQESRIEGVTKSWIFRYTSGGKSYELGLGPAPKVVTLAEARELALDARRQVQAGVNPVEQRRAEKSEAAIAKATEKTFQEFSDEYVRSHRRGWKSMKHGDQWQNTLATYAYPKIGALPIARINTPLVLTVLEQQINVAREGKAPRYEQFWTARAETASRLRGRLEKILNSAKAKGLREGENPARWEGHLDQVLLNRPRRARITHHPAMSVGDVPAFMNELAALDGVAPKALRFIVLTATRTMEAFGARWSEFDLERRLWTIPAERMKGKREHRVPLAQAAIDLLAELRNPAEGSEFVFCSPRADAPLSNMAGLALLRRLGRQDVTVHGFRSSFRDWAEESHFPSRVAEAALAHAKKDQVEAAYVRTDLLSRRIPLMEAWSQFLAKPPGSVHSIGEKRERLEVAA